MELSSIQVLYAQSLEGTEIARILSIGCFSLAVYEYMITLDEEIKYFWSGNWTPSRVLFFINRYLPLFIMVLSIVGFSVENPSAEVRPPRYFIFCDSAIKTAFLLNIIAVAVIQAILVTRNWYLFQGNRVVQFGIIGGFFTSIVLSLVFLYLSANHLQIIPPSEIARVFNAPVDSFRTEGCRAVRPPMFWRVYLPSLVLHTLLYLLTAVRAMRNRRLLKDAPILKRLLRDGGFFYFIVFVSVSMTTIGAFLENAPKINIPSIYSHFMLTATSVAVSRVLFSIHSLADKIGSDSAWLLNNVELSRVGWRRGTHEGELIVDRYPVYSDEDVESKLDGSSISGHSLLRTTRVGVYDERSW
ncbi:hypothetical protein BDZ94DRAFT_1303207 [Collybia nuda]|uniref:DUF6533 domain-containing protein n=1 Tax=Collybia nuda TaxID=64659 RepID=A0A9P6CPR7_9AGAR|nr:hypothetical protein BDZ94DRAFT_1303207 [Collybia nuda]